MSQESKGAYYHDLCLVYLVLRHSSDGSYPDMPGACDKCDRKFSDRVEVHVHNIISNAGQRLGW